MKLIDDWAKAHKFATSWVSLFVLSFGLVEAQWPAIQDALPKGLPLIVASILWSIARLAKQQITDPE